MRVKVILNPCADTGRGGEQKALIERECQEFGDFSLEVTRDRGHARELTTQAVIEGYEMVVAAGGDGTIHEVINGLLAVEGSTAKLGVIPIGSGNDFAFAYNIPNDIQAAVRLLYEGRAHPVDLGFVVDNQGRKEVFENNFGLGFDANVVIRTEAITRLRGFPKYFWGVLKTLAMDFRPFHISMRFDDETVEEDVLFVTFGIGRRHGGGFMLTPDALHNDDLIDTCTVRPMGRVHALWLLNSAVKGTHVTNPLVTMRQSKAIEIKSGEPLPIHIDGEVFAHPGDGVFSLTVNSLPARIEVVAS